MSEIRPTRSPTSDTADRVFYASVPLCGALATGCTALARGRAGGRVAATIGLVLGAFELLVSLAILIGLTRALRTLGMA